MVWGRFAFWRVMALTFSLVVAQDVAQAQTADVPDYVVAQFGHPPQQPAEPHPSLRRLEAKIFQKLSHSQPDNLH